MKTKLKSGIFTVLALFAVTVMQAAQPVTIALSTVGNPGNAADPATGSLYGNVNYTFNIGTYDVTVSQYTAFLNAVAQTDTYGLYNSALNGSGSYNGECISQSGSSGSYSYAVMGSSGNFPITYVSWFDAARFSNWLNNGQPQTHVENASTTEDGAYTLNGTMSGVSVSKNPLAQWYIPSEDEWYKAAYYDPTLNSGTGGYWTYATQSNTAPGNSWANRTLANEANYEFTMGVAPYLTPVGSFTNSASAYGTFDQAGDVFNWNDAVIYGWCRGLRGGPWNYSFYSLQSWYSDFLGPADLGPSVGIRVANAPEPTSVMLIGLGGIILASVRRKPSSR